MLRREQRHNHPRRPRWKIVGWEGKVNPTVSEVESQSNQTRPHVTTTCASHIPKSPDKNRCRTDKEKNQKRKEANSPFFSPPPSSFFFFSFPLSSLSSPTGQVTGYFLAQHRLAVFATEHPPPQEPRLPVKKGGVEFISTLNVARLCFLRLSLE